MPTAPYTVLSPWAVDLLGAGEATLGWGPLCYPPGVCGERPLPDSPRTPGSSLKSNVTAKPLFSKGGWILLAQSSLACRDFIFRVDLLMALSSLKERRW